MCGGAVEKRWHRLGREFARAGHRVAHISRRWEGLPEMEELGGVHHIRVPGFEAPRSVYWLKFLDLVYSLRARGVLQPADIVVTNTFWMPLLLRDSSKWGRVVVDFARMPKGQVRFYRHVACVRVNSEAVREAVVGEYAPIEPRVRYIPNCLPFDPPNRVDWDGKEKLLLYAGRVHPEKGLDLLADAWRDLAARCPGWRLEIAGPWDYASGGGGEAYCRKLKERFGDAPVRFHGPVHEDEKLHELYRRTSVFLFPSVAEKGETFGLAPLEAMAFGAVPVLSSLACFGAFADRGNSVVFDHRDLNAAANLAVVLEELMTSPKRRSDLGEAAFRRAGAFHPSEIAREFLTLFEELVERDGAGSSGGIGAP